MFKLGLPLIDEATGPIPTGALVLVAEPVKSGRTSIINRIVANNVRENRILYMNFEREMRIEKYEALASMGHKLDRILRVMPETSNLRVISSSAYWTPEALVAEAKEWKADMLVISSLTSMYLKLPAQYLLSNYYSAWVQKLRNVVWETRDLSVITEYEIAQWRKPIFEDNPISCLPFGLRYTVDSVLLTRNDESLGLSATLHKYRFAEVGQVTQRFLPWHP